MKHSPELIRLAIRIANMVADSREASEQCRQVALKHDLSTPLYACLLLEVAELRNQFEVSPCGP